MKKDSKKDEARTMLPGGRPFRIRCTVEQTDFFQSDFLGAYGDMLYERRRVARQTVIAVALCLALTAAVFISPAVINEYAWFTGGFALLFLAYGLYFCIRGYSNDFRTLQKYLDDCVEQGKTVYEPVSYDYDFQDSAVYFSDSTGMNRYFLYEDIRYIEQTDRLYELGMKYRPREKRLFGLDKVLITKRYLDRETEGKLLQVLDNVTREYSVKPVLEDHPFK